MNSKSAILWILGISIVSLMGYYFSDSLVSTVKSLSVGGVLVWLLITIAFRLMLAHGFAISVRHLGGTVSLLDAFFLGWSRSFFNQLVPFTGTAGNIVYMSRVMNLSWGQITSLATPLFVISLQATLLIAAVAIAGVIPLLGWVTAIAAVILAASAILLGYFGIEHLLATADRFASYAGIQLPARPTAITKFSGGVRFRLVIIFSAAATLRFLRLLALFHALGYEMPATSILFISSIAEVSNIAQVTPGGLGLRELFILAIGVVVGGQSGDLAAIALIERALTISVVLVFGVASLFALRRRSQE